MGNPSRQTRKRTVASQEDVGDVEQWAKSLVNSIGKRAARSILVDYVARAKDTKVKKYGRAVAAQQASALRKAL